MEKFGDYIRRLREENGLPLRKVAAQLDIDTSTLSKVERGERVLSKEHLKPLSEILNIELKEIQVKFITDTIDKEVGDLEFFKEGLKEAEKQIKKEKK
jgi:transcriptional regulator with XRE-family HTH domain